MSSEKIASTEHADFRSPDKDLIWISRSRALFGMQDATASLSSGASVALPASPHQVHASPLQSY
jgi:hypothetical protein